MQHLLASARNQRQIYNQKDQTLEPEIELVLTVYERRLQMVGAGLLNVEHFETLRIGMDPDGARKLAENLQEWADEADSLHERTTFTPS